MDLLVVSDFEVHAESQIEFPIRARRDICTHISIFSNVEQADSCARRVML